MKGRDCEMAKGAGFLWNVPRRSRVKPPSIRMWRGWDVCWDWRPTCSLSWWPLATARFALHRGGWDGSGLVFFGVWTKPTRSKGGKHLPLSLPGGFAPPGEWLVHRAGCVHNDPVANLRVSRAPEQAVHVRTQGLSVSQLHCVWQ